MEKIENFEQLKKNVINTNLCTRCGSCAGLSKGSVVMGDYLGKCLPEPVGKPIDSTFYDSCSGKYVPFPKLNQLIFGKQPENFLLGNYEEAYIGYSTDESIRRGGGSAGVLSTILIYLLEKKLIDGAVVLGEENGKPWKTEVKIARTREDVLKCAQSKYVISPINTVIETLEKEDGKFAYVGLPCETHAMRKLQMMKHPVAMKIKYFIGPYCGNTLHFDAIRSYLRKYGVKSENEIVSLKYREGEWPGHMRVELKNGRVLSLPKMYANYFTPFYIMDRCKTCIDLTNEFTDISVGDAWSPVYEERGRGWSVIVGRTNIGMELLKRMVDENCLHLDKTTELDVMNMHSNTLDFKKRGAFIRMGRMKRRGIPTPEYDIEVEGITWKRRFMESILGFLFFVASLGVSKTIINYIPMNILGGTFVRVRKFWKKSTISTKKEGMLNMKVRYKL